MGFFDVDEFVFPVELDTLPGESASPDLGLTIGLAEVLQDYEAFGGLTVRNVLFGSSGYSEQPPVRDIVMIRFCDLSFPGDGD